MVKWLRRAGRILEIVVGVYLVVTAIVVLVGFVLIVIYGI